MSDARLTVMLCKRLTLRNPKKKNPDAIIHDGLDKSGRIF
jgi:hypothetical protein